MNKIIVHIFLLHIFVHDQKKIIMIKLFFIAYFLLSQVFCAVSSSICIMLQFFFPFLIINVLHSPLVLMQAFFLFFYFYSYGGKLLKTMIYILCYSYIYLFHVKNFIV